MDNMIEIDKWCIAEENFNVKLNKHYEGLFTQGNGYISVRGCFEEGLDCAPQDEEYLRMPANVTLEKPRNPLSKYGTYIPGIVGSHPLLKEEIINLPYMLDFKVWFEGERLDMQHCTIESYQRWLNMHDGTLHRSFLWTTGNGAKIKLYYKRFISMKRRNLIVQHISVSVLQGNGELVFETGIDARVRTNGYNHFKSVGTVISGENCLKLVTTTDNDNEVLQATSIRSDYVLDWKPVLEENRVFSRAQAYVCKGTEINICKLSAASTDRDMEVGAVTEKATEQLMSIEGISYEELYGEHAGKWSEKWENSDVVINGDEKAQQALRFSIYHLIRSNAEDDPRVAICAKGYSGEAYFGRYFWDTEINMLPFFIYTNPKAARNLLMFRFLTLKGAKENAEKYGYKGARYAWESSITGEEQCPNWQYADNEIHITADIVYGLWHYYKATGDEEFMKRNGIDILVETSRYWTSRVDENKNGGYDLLGVMGPDEYLPFTKNNAFTNRMVKFNLEKTLEYLEHVKASDTLAHSDITDRLDVREDELKLFAELHKKLIIPYDEQTELILQSEDFYEYADLNFDEVWKDRTKPFGNFVSQESMYRSKCLKQADVLEMMMLFRGEFTTEQVERAYNYYEPITTHDSSLSAAVHGIISIWLDMKKEAMKFLNKCMDIDLSHEKGGAAEGIHIANCGGLWQLIVFGFAGLRSAAWEDGQIIAEPNLPDNWSSIEIPLIWRGKRCRLIVEKKRYKLVALP